MGANQDIGFIRAIRRRKGTAEEKAAEKELRRLERARVELIQEELRLIAAGKLPKPKQVPFRHGTPMDDWADSEGYTFDGEPADLDATL